MISAEQRFTILARLAENVDWGLFNPEQLQVSLRDGKRAGKEMTAFMQNGFCMQIGDDFRQMEKIAIQIPALSRPTIEELQAQYSWIKSIERDNSPTEAVKLSLATVLRSDETESISGVEYERRLIGKLDLILGYQQAKWLVEHQDGFPDFMALLGKIYIDFSGLIVVNVDGLRYFPYLSQSVKRWYLHWDWFSSDFNPNVRVAVSSK
jgi:hypothetical protein